MRWMPTFLVCAALVAGPSVAARGATPARETKLHALVNEVRLVAGFNPLAMTDRLSRIAERHSRRMADLGSLFHSDLGRLASAGATAEIVGFGVSVEPVMTEFMSSLSHRHIILDARWRKTGVGIVRSGGRLWVTEVFK